MTKGNNGREASSAGNSNTRPSEKVQSPSIPTLATSAAYTPAKHSAIFEQEVRRVARELFPQSGGYGPVIIDGRERDGVLNDGETIHIIEATCDPKKAKAEQDLNKSFDLKRELSRVFPDHNFKIWFITERDPTADQNAVADAARKRAKCPVLAMSLSTFGQRLVDAPAYLAARSNYHFGSVRNLDPDQPQKPVDKNEFIPIDMIDTATLEAISPTVLADRFLTSPGLYALIGDFGAGKSMTMRHLFFHLAETYRQGRSARFPVYLNLRDHVGQDDPASALYDHGTRIGFSQPERLVRGWRAGFIHLFLDGFDEIASSRFRSGSEGLRAVRRRAMTLVRKFIEEHPAHLTALFLSGRENYFSSPEERAQLLSLTGRRVTTLSLNEFTLEQVQEYLARLGLDGNSIPDWLPSRPLLVGYLAVRRTLSEPGIRLADMTRAEGWDYLLDKICQREGGQIADLGGQAQHVRAFLERLATYARATNSGRGPVPVKDMIELFRETVPSSPDEAAQQLLLRMAGMTVSPGAASTVVTSTPDQEDSREFVDDDLVDAARAGDVVRFINYGYDEALNRLFLDRDCSTAMGDLGVEVACAKLGLISDGQASAALNLAAQRLNSPVLALDILHIMQRLKLEAKSPDKGEESIVIRDGFFDSLELVPSVNLSRVSLFECMITNLYLDPSAGRVTGPKLVKCQVEKVFGAISRGDVPVGVFDDQTEVSSYMADVETNHDLREQRLQPSVFVLLTVLRKLFMQAGRGRKENAFPRGLDDVEKAYVEDVLDLVAKHDFAHPQRVGGPTVWMPNRTKTGEARSIIHAPRESTHPLIVDVRAL